MMILIWVAIGFGIYYIVKNNNTNSNTDQNIKSPENILKERYVNGEIDDATYERMKKAIN